jgi:hypothetical protein
MNQWKIGRWKKTPNNSRTRTNGNQSNNKGRTIKDVALKVQPHIELVEEKVITAYLKVGINPLVVVQVEATNTIVVE